LKRSDVNKEETTGKLYKTIKHTQRFITPNPEEEGTAKSPPSNLL